MRNIPVLILIILPLLGNVCAGGELPDLTHEQQVVTNIIAGKARYGGVLPDSFVLEMAIAGYSRLKAEGRLSVPSVLTVIDYSLPSTAERLWVFDVNSGKLLYNCLVAHGRNSGELYATAFSNIPGSFTSSEGFYLTGDTYYGRHGLSLYLDGLEDGINHNARDRYIVIHSADYVTREFIKKHGRLGRSHGCPAIPPHKHKDIIRTIKGGSCLFIYAPVEDYTEKSSILNKGSDDQV